MKLLVAEDSSSSRMLMTRILEQHGHEVVQARDGREALGVLESDEAPTIALLDWLMPEYDGLAVCRKVREKAKTTLPYIIMVTAKSDNDALVSAFDAGADDFINKPFKTEELICRVRAGVRIVALHNENAAYMIRLQHQQKLESVGQLAAGVAHEINTPAQYIGDNARFLADACNDVHSLLALYDEIDAEAARKNFAPSLFEKISAKKEDIDLPFLLDEVPSAVQQCIQGIDAISRIVQALKEFAHPGTNQKSPVNLHQVLKNTIAVSKNEWKYVATLETDFDKSLPPVYCIPGDVGQVFINLIVNAAHAIDYRKQADSGAEGRIRITTSRHDDTAVIRISDTGTGIPKAIQDRIFDPFFTTKEVGKGTGQGLAIAHDIVVKRHGGSLDFETGPDGTTFVISLPLDTQDA